MKKNKLIQVRLTDEQFIKLTRMVDRKDQSLSEFIREMIEQLKTDPEAQPVPVREEETPVFQRPEFLKTVIWIYQKREHSRSDNSLDEAKSFLELIDSFLRDLDPAYMAFFFNVRKDLTKVIKEYSPLYGITYDFTKSYNPTYFDYDEFEKMLLKDLG